jgi:hypothetical protein
MQKKSIEFKERWILHRRPDKKAKSPVKEPISALRIPEGRVKTKSPSEYCARVLTKKRSCPYDLIQDLLGHEGSGRGDLSIRGEEILRSKLRREG